VTPALKVVGYGPPGNVQVVDPPPIVTGPSRVFQPPAAAGS